MVFLVSGNVLLILRMLLVELFPMIFDDSRLVSLNWSRLRLFASWSLREPSTLQLMLLLACWCLCSCLVCNRFIAICVAVADAFLVVMLWKFIISLCLAGFASIKEIKRFKWQESEDVSRNKVCFWSTYRRCHEADGNRRLQLSTSIILCLIISLLLTPLCSEFVLFSVTWFLV